MEKKFLMKKKLIKEEFVRTKFFFLIKLKIKINKNPFYKKKLTSHKSLLVITTQHIDNEMVVRSAFFNLAMFFGVCLFNFYKVEIVGGWFFQQIGPLGQFVPEVVMSVRLCTYVSPPHAIFCVHGLVRRVPPPRTGVQCPLPSRGALKTGRCSELDASPAGVQKCRNVGMQESNFDCNFDRNFDGNFDSNF